MKRNIGFVVFAIGMVLLTLAYQSANAPLEKFFNTIAGGYSDGTMLYFALGIAAAVGGGPLATLGGRK